MKHDKVFWIVIALFVVSGVMNSVSAWQFTAKNTFGNERYADEVLSRLTEVPDITQKYVSWVAENKTEFLEIRARQFVRDSLGAVFGTSLIAFIFLSVRQHKLINRIEKLEADRRGE